MAITQLTVKHVQPDLSQASEALNQSDALTTYTDLLTMQPRMASALSLFCTPNRQRYSPRFMLLKAPESDLFFSLLNQSVKSKVSVDFPGYCYHVNETKITLTEAKSPQDNFASQGACFAASFIDAQTLFGCVRQPENDHLKLQSGLLHHANGGVLILGLRALLAQPNLWLRLKHMVTKQEFDWFSTDDSHPLPLSIPPLPLDLRIILVGDRLSLAELQDNEPEFYQTALYCEFENELNVKSPEHTKQWLAYNQFIANQQQLPPIAPSAYCDLIKEATRFTQDQHYLPLSVDWINNLLVNASYFATDSIDKAAIKQASNQITWRQNYLVERFREEIFTNQITINTKEQIVGQINGLSVIEYPGYPVAIGEPTRLSCLIHYGDGELIDIERKTELAGNIHTKGMMIMQAFIMSEFAIHNQLPFSASLVFEQSYSEIDGDSASLAGLCVLMSALSNQPIDQQLAVTGSVDQFGHVQSIGGVNQKIEGFFAVCKHQGLTGQQGVIIPASNQRHLCLSDEIIEAVEQQKFSILAVENVSDALHLLTGIPYKDDNKTITLYKLIQSRILSLMMQDKKSEGWFSRWQKFCKKSQ